MMISAPVIAIGAGLAWLAMRKKSDPEVEAATDAAEAAAESEPDYGGGGGGGGGGATPTGAAPIPAVVTAPNGAQVSTAVFKRKKPAFSVPLKPKPPGGDPAAYRPASALNTSNLAAVLAQQGAKKAPPPFRAPLPAPKPGQSPNASQTSVLNAQTLLKKLGIPFGALDGLYGPKTAAAWAKAVAKYPPAQGPEYERRGTFTRVNGTTALVYRPSAERLAAVATGKAAPVSSAVTPRKPTLSAPSGFAASLAPKPSGRTPPPGYDRRAAQAMAPALVKHLKARGRDGYARAEMRKFQTYAGIAADGIYGRGSYAALKHFAPNAPAPFYAQGTAVYPWA